MGVVLVVLLYAFISGNLQSGVGWFRVAAPVGSGGGTYQVEIRNGCGVDGIARQTAAYLRQYGYDVVESGNYEDFDQDVSRVIDRGGNREDALGLARTLGISDEMVAQEIRPELLLNATIVIGKDYRTLRPFVETD